MYLSLQRRAIFRHRNFKKWSAPDSFLAFWLENVLLATAACNFSCPLQSYLRTRRFSEVTFRPSRHTKHWKTQHFATSLTFRACGSSFFPHLLIFFLAALLFQLSILSEVRLLNFLRLEDWIQIKDRITDRFVQYSHCHCTTKEWMLANRWFSNDSLQIWIFSTSLILGQYTPNNKPWITKTLSQYVSMLWIQGWEVSWQLMAPTNYLTFGVVSRPRNEPTSPEGVDVRPEKAE